MGPFRNRRLRRIRDWGRRLAHILGRCVLAGARSTWVIDRFSATAVPMSFSFSVAVRSDPAAARSTSSWVSERLAMRAMG
ncbi:MAG: hypothetical protein U1E70_05840 [Acetobacteraceae bacterium]